MSIVTTSGATSGAAPKIIILRRRADFLAVAASGKKWITPGMIVQVRPRVDLPDAPAVIGFGLTASRKVGNAVARNRARRRLRALACQFLPISGKGGHDYVLIAREAAITRAHEDLKKDLLWALRKLSG